MGKLYFEAAAVLCSILTTPVARAVEVPRPRGVGPEFAKFYKDATTFTCISNPSTQIPAARVNDDYCDCPDGSDEPGTSACAHLSPLSPPRTPPDRSAGAFNETLALPGFYCKNKGHMPLYVPFTHVNDGVCDYEVCCDGSEEWEGVGGVKCEDRCAKIGKEWRKLDEARKKSMGVADQRRKQLVVQAARLRKEVQDRISTLATQTQAAQVKVQQLEKQLADTERQEKGKVIKGAGQGGKLTVLSSLAKGRINALVESLTRVRGERDTATARVQELEGMLSKFKEEYNPNFNDEGVKRAVKAWEDYAAQDRRGPDAAQEADLDHVLRSDADNGIEWAEYEGTGESDVDVLYRFEAYLPAPVREWVDGKLRELRILLIENGMLADPRAGTGESKTVADARAQLTAAQDELNRDAAEKAQHEQDLDRDYGPDDVFRALQGQCVEKESGEYTYELCWLDKTTQKAKKGGAATGMGNFAGLATTEADDGLPAHGQGVGRGRRTVMHFDQGQHCWNGPDRSTQVVLACAEKCEIWKIAEEEKCVYRMEVGTPAVCQSASQSQGQGADPGQAKDEL